MLFSYAVRVVVAAGLAVALSAAHGAETEVVYAPGAPGQWTTERDAGRLRAELSESRLEPGPNGLRWRFVSRGPAFNDIFWHAPIKRSFSSLRLRVTNSGAAMRLAVKLGDADRAEWTAGTVDVPGDGVPRWLEMPAPRWQVASWSRDPNGRMDFPLAYLAVIAFDVRPGDAHDLVVHRVEAVRPDPPLLKLSRFDVPGRMVHGRTYRASVRFTLAGAVREPGAWLAFRRAGARPEEPGWRVPVPLPQRVPLGRAVEAALVAVPIPEFVVGGRHTVSLEVGEARVRGQGSLAGKEVRTVNVEARKPGALHAELRKYKGAPTLFINGKPHSGMAYTAYGPSVEVFRDFAQAGVHLYSFSATPTEAGYGLSKTAWTAPGTYDFSELDKRAQMVLQADPHAYVFPRLYLHAPKWWSEQHPDDVVLMDPGDGKPVPFVHSGGKPVPSWASEAWRKATVEGLERLIAHVKASPYADRCIGYHIASGTTEEWMMWGGNEDEWVDFSPVNQARFRQWLRARYGTEDRLRAAWADPSVAFGTASVPLKTARQRSAMGALRDPASEQAVIDFYEYNSDLVAETINYFAREVKRIAGRDRVVGTFYGYLLQLCGEQRQQNGGHLALAKVLASPDVDFVCSPTSYAFRQLGGEGTSHFMSLLGSVRLHGKLWFNENDVRTSVSGGQVGEWGRPADVAGDVLQQDKELANAFVNGAAQWWFDVGGNRYDAPALMERIGELTRNADTVVGLDRTPADQVALVVDEVSLGRLRTADPMGAWLLVQQLPALRRIGAPVDDYLVTDLPRIADRRVFIFATSFAPTDADRRAVDALKGDGRVLVFMPAAGLYRGAAVEAAAVAGFTSVAVQVDRQPASLRAAVVGGHPLTEGLAGVPVGVNHVAWPVVRPADPGAVTLAEFADGRPAIVVKRHADWTAVYSAVPMLPASLLRRVAALGGVHTYIDTEDVVWACRDLVAVCVKEGGARRVRLPRKARVRDLFTGRVVSPDGGEFEAEFAPRATRVFLLEGAR